MGDRTIKAIIFDWGRTLYDNDNKSLFSGVEELLGSLSQKYTLALVSLVGEGTIEERQEAIQRLGVDKYFVSIMLTYTDKDRLYDETLEKISLQPHEIGIVDDRVVRGIRWGNAHGCLTVWVRKGMFSNELPNNETGQPTYTVTDIREIEKLF